MVVHGGETDNASRLVPIKMTILRHSTSHIHGHVGVWVNKSCDQWVS
jgi:hypothetical protein